jgi:3-phosphoshikimate 1-carboxyvinyltransferase
VSLVRFSCAAHLDDSEVMQKALKGNDEVVDIHRRNCYAISLLFCANEGREVVLTGSQRMTERPIKVL